MSADAGAMARENKDLRHGYRDKHVEPEDTQQALYQWAPR
jgi:hypothetical protein